MQLSPTLSKIYSIIYIIIYFPMCALQIVYHDPAAFSNIIKIWLLEYKNYQACVNKLFIHQDQYFSLDLFTSKTVLKLGVWSKEMSCSFCVNFSTFPRSLIFEWRRWKQEQPTGRAKKFHSCFVNFQPSDDLFLFFKSNRDQAGCTSDLADSLSAKHNQWRQSCEELAPDL